MAGSYSLLYSITLDESYKKLAIDVAEQIVDSLEINASNQPFWSYSDVITSKNHLGHASNIVSGLKKVETMLNVEIMPDQLMVKYLSSFFENSEWPASSFSSHDTKQKNQFARLGQLARVYVIQKMLEHEFVGTDELSAYYAGGHDFLNSIYKNANHDSFLNTSSETLAYAGMGLSLEYSNGDESFLATNAFTYVSNLTDDPDRYALKGGTYVSHGLGGDDVLKGNKFRNILYGDEGNDFLFGYEDKDQLFGGNGSDFLDGGPSNDILVGGLGDDTYVIDNILDIADESPGEGVDTIKTFVSFSIHRLPNIENIYLKGEATQAKGNINDNIIVGNDLDNILRCGVSGSDVMIGGKGADVFIVNQRTTVLDFEPSEDTLIMI